MATNIAANEAPVTLVAVLIISTILDIGAKMTIISIGKPALANNAVAVIVAVPGTPTVPKKTTTAKTIKNKYCPKV